jgi:sugar lactone lactonase YvrE
VRAYDPAGKLMQTVELPFDLPTCREFGGRNLDTPYVTSATLHRDAAALAGQKKPGSLFAIRGLGAKGLPLVPFKGQVLPYLGCREKGAD